MKTFTAILAAAIIGFAAIARADSNDPVTIEDYLHFNSEQIASYYTMYLSRLADSPKVDLHIRNFIYTVYVENKEGDQPTRDLLDTVYQLATQQNEPSLPIKNVIDHVIRQKFAAWSAANPS